MENLVGKIKARSFLEDSRSVQSVHSSCQCAPASYNQLLDDSLQLIEYFRQSIFTINNEHTEQIQTLHTQQLKLQEDNVQLKNTIEELEAIINGMREQLILNNEDIERLRGIVEDSENKIDQSCEQNQRREQRLLEATKSNIENIMQNKQKQLQQVKAVHQETINELNQMVKDALKENQKHIKQNGILADRVEELMKYIAILQSHSEDLGCSPKLLYNSKSLIHSDQSPQNGQSIPSITFEDNELEQSFEGQKKMLQDILNIDDKSRESFGYLQSKQRLMRIYKGEENKINSININSYGSDHHHTPKCQWNPKEINQFSPLQINSKAKKEEQACLNPYYCFFLITVQNQKITSKNFEQASKLDLNGQWQILTCQQIPLHKWSAHIRSQIRKLVALSQN